VDATERRVEAGGVEIFLREAPPPGGRAPVLYVHGSPTSSDDWLPFLSRSGGSAPDLPGFGRSGKRGDGDYTMHRYGPWLASFLAARGVDRYRLVVHDWGGIALTLAQEAPERVQRLVIINSVPLLPGYRWHRTARAWRTRVLGELAMGCINPFTLKQLTRESNVTRGPLPEDWRKTVIEHFDLGTQRAILRLYRSADPEALAAAGARLSTLTCPTLVVWGDADPYIPPSFGAAFAAAIPGAQLLALPDAGHWPWLDRPDVVDTVAAFLAG
jgi:pimeloyl-ACP methyl ester carboxylesterase